MMRQKTKIYREYINWLNITRHSIDKRLEKRLPFEILSRSYMGMTTSDRFHLANGNSYCETNVYLHPPNQNVDTSLHAKCVGGVKIRDPLWLDYLFNLADREWRNDYINAVPKFSILICDSTKASTCYSKPFENNWISTVLGYGNQIRKSENVLILKLLANTKNYSLLVCTVTLVILSN